MLSTTRRHVPAAGPGRQRGLSIVELLVGVTLGLFVVAAAALMVSTQLAENRRFLLETQLQQDLRSTMDIITRELRRVSYNPNTAGEVWFEGKTALMSENASGAIRPTSGATLSEIGFDYLRRSGETGDFGFKHEGYVIKSKISTQWQTMTDANVMRVTAFNVNLAAPVVYQLPCPKLCPDGTQDCWPELQLRAATVTITGQSVADTNITRTLQTQVRMRNDWTRFNAAEVCPA